VVAVGRGLETSAGAGVAGRAENLVRGRGERLSRPPRPPTGTRPTIASALQDAIGRGELRAVFQPIVAIRDRSWVSAEALLRWRHPVLGDVPPCGFIPIAEETGMIVPIGAWVLDEACRQLARWTAVGTTPITLSVNVSGHQLLGSGFAASVAATLDRCGVAASRLWLELTESVLLEDTDPVADNLADLHNLGVRLALDDFGTGYSSLLCLKRFPIEVIKLERSFVAGIGADPTDTAIVKSSIDLAHSLGIRALAEGVERPEQLEVLAEMGCDLGQGYLWSAPLAASRLADFATH
jgi:EAL domain-containing protein (putative c-di-GMP-specific phosphodiesterase class I)